MTQCCATCNAWDQSPGDAFGYCCIQPPFQLTGIDEWCRQYQPADDRDRVEDNPHHDEPPRDPNRKFMPRDIVAFPMPGIERPMLGVVARAVESEGNVVVAIGDGQYAMAAESLERVGRLPESFGREEPT